MEHILSKKERDYIWSQIEQYDTLPRTLLKEWVTMLLRSDEAREELIKANEQLNESIVDNQTSDYLTMCNQDQSTYM